MNNFLIRWHDSGREPTEKPNPNYPNGVDLDVTHGMKPSCLVKLPYPAKRCGLYYVKCVQCGVKAAITTAGRPDDPCSVRLPCKTNISNN